LQERPLAARSWRDQPASGASNHFAATTDGGIDPRQKRPTRQPCYCWSRPTKSRSVQLRYLQTLAGNAGDKTNIIVFGFRTSSWIC